MSSNKDTHKAQSGQCNRRRTRRDGSEDWLWRLGRDEVADGRIVGAEIERKKAPAEARYGEVLAANVGEEVLKNGGKRDETLEVSKVQSRRWSGLLVQ